VVKELTQAAVSSGQATRDKLRVRETMTLEELVENHHCGGMPRADLGTIGVMQHTVLVRYRNERRKSGAPAASHFFCVQDVLADLDFGPICELIGLGHDLIEDGVMSLDEILDNFGERVTTGILVLSKRPEHKEDDAGYFAQVLEAVKNGLWEAGVVKLADRAHNLRTLEAFKDPERETSYLASTADNALWLADQAWPWIEQYAPKHTESYEVLCNMLHKEYEIQLQRLEPLARERG